MDRPADVTEWISQHRPERQEQVRRLAELVYAADDRIDVAIKWHRLTFTVEGNWHHWLCGIQVTKAGVSLLLHKGALLDDPADLLQGDGRYLRKIPFDEAAAEPDAVTAIVRSAISNQTQM
jgi:hypothetical protein